MFSFFRSKCVICGESDNLVDIEIPVFMDWPHVYYYHKGCILDVVCHPEEYTTDIINKANDIITTLNIEKSKRDLAIAKAKRLCKELI